MKNKLVKRILATAMSCTLIFMLASCGGGGGNTGNTGSTGSAPPASGGGSGSDASAGDVTINWWVGTWKYEDGRAQKLVEDFEAANPGIKVEITPVAFEGLKEKLLSTLMAKQGPDVMNMASAWGKAMAATGSLMDMGPVIDEIGRDKFYEAGFEWTKLDGVEYGIPYRTEAKCLYYNNEMLKAAGLDGPPETLAELADYAQKLKTADVAGLALPLNRDDPTVGMYFRWVMRAFGGDYMSEDETTATLTTPEALQAFQYYTDLYTSGSMPADTLALTNDDTRVLFENGQAAMTVEGPWAIANCEANGLDFGIAQLPGLDGQDGTWDSAGWSLIVADYSPNKEAAVKFVKFLLEPDNDAYMTDALPAIREAASAEKYQTEYFQTYVAQLDHMHPVFSSPNTTSIYQAVGIGLQRMFQGEDVKTVAEEVNAEVQELIDTGNE